jgi:uncharacterized membrane protein
MITLAQPIWLLLLFPLMVAVWLWPAPTRLLQIVRIVVLGLIVLAMCAPLLRLPSRAGTVVVVADRSLSMPANATAQELETIDLVQKQMTGRDRLAVVSFGYDSAIDRAPDVGKFAEFVNEVAPDGSNLGEALEKTLTLFPEDAPGRILLLSDGKWTGVDPVAVAAVAASRAISIDFRDLSRPSASDLAIDSLSAPIRTHPGESFMIGAWVRVPIAQTIHYELLRGHTRIASGDRDLASGVSRLVFRDIAGEPGISRYILRVTGSGEDPVPENNTAKALIGIEGPRPILHLTESGAGGLAGLLEAGGLRVSAVKASNVDWSLDFLSGYAGVIIENIPAAQITESGMQLLAEWVQQTGSGLMMTGGRQSYGPGGYFKSPLEPILPVSMELRQEHRKFSVAIAVALDRSGSMTAPVGGGKTKMDLANLGTAQVVDLLSSMDELGVVAVDSSSHIIVPMGPVEHAGAIRAQVLHIQSMGGGIFVYEALSTAVGMLSSAKPLTKHVILFADAMDSEEPGDYKRLVDDWAAAGNTVSVIGLGTERDVDAEFLRDIARRGNGRIYFTADPQELPRLFAQDTFVIARSSFVDVPTPVRMTGGLIAVSGRTYDDPPPVGGYNLCYIRDTANLAAVTTDEYSAPLVATWQAGTGRVACYTGEADGQFTGPIANWPELGNLFTGLARWTAGNDVPLPSDMVVEQKIDSGVYHVLLHLDRDRPELDLKAMPTVTILRGKAGATPSVHRATMRWASTDMLSVEIPLRSDETALATLELPGHGVHALTPVCLPYSPEFEPANAKQGLVCLEQLARSTGGKQRIDLGGIWSDLARQPRLLPVAHWLLIAVVTLFLLEVLERRTGAISMLSSATRRGRKAARKPQAAEGAPAARQGQVAKPVVTRASPGKLDKPATPAAAPKATPAPTGMSDALRQAQYRAGKRTGKSP